MKRREAAVSICGNVRNRVGKPACRRHHVRSHRVRLPPGSRSTKRRLRSAISDASSSPRRVESTSSGQRLGPADEDWRICPVFPQYLPADHVRGVKRARHERGDPVSLSLRFETRDGLR